MIDLIKETKEAHTFSLIHEELSQALHLFSISVKVIIVLLSSENEAREAGHFLLSLRAFTWPSNVQGVYQQMLVRRKNKDVHHIPLFSFFIPHADTIAFKVRASPMILQRSESEAHRFTFGN